MTPTGELQPSGEKMRRTVRWISEALQLYPEKSRAQVIREAQIRFDLSPLESAFVSEKFGPGLEEKQEKEEEKG